jgi:hypothetical protein
MNSTKLISSDNIRCLKYNFGHLLELKDHWWGKGGWHCEEVEQKYCQKLQIWAIFKVKVGHLGSIILLHCINFCNNITSLDSTIDVILQHWYKNCYIVAKFHAMPEVWLRVSFWGRSVLRYHTTISISHWNQCKMDLQRTHYWSTKAMSWQHCYTSLKSSYDKLSETDPIWVPLPLTFCTILSSRQGVRELILPKNAPFVWDLEHHSFVGVVPFHNFFVNKNNNGSFQSPLTCSQQ